MSLLVDIEKKVGDFTLRVKFETVGGVMGLLGASGCGKSMTLGCIAGIITPNQGRIVLDGVTLFDSEKHINLPPQKRNVGVLFQHYALFPNMTVKQNIICGMHGEKNKALQKARLDEILQLLHLEGLEKRRPAQLSGGQAQRVALARILVGKPRLLLLDEPFSALDMHLRGQLQIQMKQLLANFGKDVLLVTHSRDEAYHLCQHIAIMEEGQLLTMKPTKALFADPASIPAARLTGCKNITSARKVGDYEVEATQWGVRLQTAQPVGDDVVAIGIRAHYFSPKSSHNQQKIVYIGEMEEPFEWIIQFRYATQSPDSPDLWWRLPKDRRTDVFPESIGISPSNVLLLYPSPDIHP